MRLHHPRHLCPPVVNDSMMHKEQETPTFVPCLHRMLLTPRRARKVEDVITMSLDPSQAP